MASTMPIPLPPRTPTPPPDDDDLDRFQNSPTKSFYDPMSLSPMDENFPFNRYGAVPAFQQTTLQLPGLDTSSMYSPMSVQSNDSTGSTRLVEDGKGVFNFQPASMAKAPVAKSTSQNIGQRRGHKYKHSSVSHQFFQEPEARAPLALPKSLDVPTFKECRHSMTKDQQVRFGCSIFHMCVAAWVLWFAEGSLALTALSHLLLFDALGAMLCVSVDILSNFEVWKRSSIRHPFGLERTEVLAGFAMSVLLLFMGGDLISHNLQHSLEGMGDHEAHHSHEHQRVSAGEVDTSALLAIAATLVSALVLKNHARIGKTMRFAYIESLPSILANPSHFLTLSCSFIMLILPLLSIEVYQWFDLALCVTMAVSMCTLGYLLVKRIGLMLLMSYDSGEGVAGIMREIEKDPMVTEIEAAKFWQVHYGLCIATLKLRVRGSEESLSRLRDKVSSLVRGRLEGGYGSGGTRWEVSVQLDIDRF